MPFIRPTLSQIKERIQADINTRLPGADSNVRRSFLNVLARTLSGAFYLLYGYLDFVSRQALPDTAESEYLERHASIWGVARKASTKAEGTITFTGTNGSTIPSGTLLQRLDGIEYETTEQVLISAGEATADIRALVAGEEGNTDTGTSLNFVSPITGVDATAETGELSGGTDTETDDGLRERLLQRIQNPPHGGTQADYVNWAKEVPGVTRAWAYPNELGAGTVTVRFMMDGTYADGIPLSGDVEDVQAYIDARRPITADVTVVAPVAVELDFTIDLKKANGNDEDSETVRAAVEAELQEMVKRDAEPGGTIYISRIREAISVAAGEHHHNITVPSANVTHTAGQIALFGEITWN